VEDNKLRVAQPIDWQTTSIPDDRKKTIALNRTYSQDAMVRIRLGLVPEAMEDKWFIYWQGDRLYIHRSWTGMCLYVARFIADSEVFYLIEADVNMAAMASPQPTDDQHREAIAFLIDVLLLNDVGALSGTDLFLQLGVIPRLMEDQESEKSKRGRAFYYYDPSTGAVEIISGTLPDGFEAAKHHDHASGSKRTAYSISGDEVPVVKRAAFVPKSKEKKEKIRQYLLSLAQENKTKD